MPLHLVWRRRPDGMFNADCPCGATLCGYPEVPDPAMVELRLSFTREQGEEHHFTSRHSTHYQETPHCCAWSPDGMVQCRQPLADGRCPTHGGPPPKTS